MSISSFIVLLEGISYLAGKYYLRFKPREKDIRFFVNFLLFTFLVEIIGSLTMLVHVKPSLSYLKETFLVDNFWLYNPYIIISFAVYAIFFSQNLKSDILKRIIRYSTIAYVLACILNLVLTDVFLNNYSAFSFMLGVVLLFLAISFYYFELLNSNKVLSIGKSVKFYISAASLIFHIISVPLWIYFKYYSYSLSPEFVDLYHFIFRGANIFLYSTYILAFLYCAKKMDKKDLHRE